jgi:hypothetical protein
MTQSPKILAFLSLLGTAGCGLLAGPISDATKSAFDVPMIDDARFSDDRVQALESEHTLTPDANVTTLPVDASTRIWGPVIRSHVAALAANQPGIFRIDVSDFSLNSAEPLVLNVTPSSRDGRVWGLRPGAEPRDPRSCHFRLDPAASGDELGRRLTMCAEDWVSENGVPNELELTITAGGQLPEGQKGLSGDPFQVSWKQRLYTEHELEESCKVVKMDPEVAANGASLDLGSAEISGWGYSDVSVFLGAFAIVNDADGVPTALAVLNQAISGGTAYWIISAAEKPPADLAQFTLAGNVQPVLSPGMPQFPFSVVDGLAGTSGAGPGEAIACWSVYGAAPRRGGIGMTVKGEASLRGLDLESAGQ